MTANIIDNIFIPLKSMIIKRRRVTISTYSRSTTASTKSTIIGIVIKVPILKSRKSIITTNLSMCAA